MLCTTACVGHPDPVCFGFLWKLLNRGREFSAPAMPGPWHPSHPPPKRSQVPGPRSQVPGPSPRSRVPDPGSQVPGPRSQVPSPGSRVRKARWRVRSSAARWINFMFFYTFFKKLYIFRVFVIFFWTLPGVPRGAGVALAP